MAGDGERLPLAARHRADRLLRVGNVDADLDHLVMSNAVHLVHAQKPERTWPFVEFPPHKEIARHAHQRVERQILVDGSDAGKAGIAGRPEAGRFAFYENLPLGRLVDAAEQPNEGGFSRAVVTQKSMHFAAIDIDIDTIERGERAEALDQAFYSNNRYRHGQIPPVMRLRTLSLRKTAIKRTTPTKTR